MNIKRYLVLDRDDTQDHIDIVSVKEAMMVSRNFWPFSERAKEKKGKVLSAADNFRNQMISGWNAFNNGCDMSSGQVEGLANFVQITLERVEDRKAHHCFPADVRHQYVMNLEKAYKITQRWLNFVAGEDMH